MRKILLFGVLLSLGAMGCQKDEQAFAAKEKIAKRYNSKLLTTFNLTVVPSPVLIPINANKVDEIWVARQKTLKCLAYDTKIKICDYEYYFVNPDKLVNTSLPEPYKIRNEWFSENQDKICYALLEQNLAARHTQSVEPLGTNKPQPVCSSMKWKEFKANINRIKPSVFANNFDDINYELVLKLTCSNGSGTNAVGFDLIKLDEDQDQDQAAFSFPSLRALEKYRGLNDDTLVDIYFDESSGKPLLLVQNSAEYNTVVYNFSGTLP